METQFLPAIGGLIVFFFATALFKRHIAQSSSRSRPMITTATISYPNPGPSRTIRFNDVSFKPVTLDQDLSDLVDALTGAPLEPNSGLYQCRRCKAFYQGDSYDVIQNHNGNKCVACLHTDIGNVVGRLQVRAANTAADTVTLHDYRQFVGQVISFQGCVHAVRRSRKRTAFAIMFEDAPWTRGFKLVVLKENVRTVGGPSFLLGLAGHNVKIRGLLIHHKLFGYQVVVTGPGIILSIE
jgi:hypothetical protein